MSEDKVKKDIPRILIVDDVEENRFVLKDIISDMGYQPILTENGAQALKIVERFSVRLIILDIAMPVMDGFEFCRIMKESPDTRDIPIIFISAFDDPSDIVNGFQLGGEDFITKPFIPEVVKVRVNVHLKLYDTNKELAEMNRRLQISVNEQVKMVEKEKRHVFYALLRVVRENACYEEKHIERLCYNCRVLAEAMQLSNKYEDLVSDTYVDILELAAPLCDLGNVAIPTEILQKNASLTPGENAIMQKHTTIGARILRDIRDAGDDNAFIQMSIDIANYHHENWDGSGYPTGKKGEEIPLPAQILAIVSAYCALTEGRAYRQAYSGEEAIEMMESDVGKKFNSDIFQIMKKIFWQLH